MRDDAKRAPLLGVMCCILCKIFRFFLEIDGVATEDLGHFCQECDLRNEKEEEVVYVVSKATLVDDLT